VTTDEVRSLLEQLAARERAADAAAPSVWPTPQCVPLSRLFIWIETGDASGVDSAHLATCPYCQAAVRKLRATPTDPDWVPVPTDAPATPSELLVRHNVWVQPDVSLATLLQRTPHPSAPDTASGRQPLALTVVGAEESLVELPPELGARYYDPLILKVKLALLLFPVPDGWEPRVQVDPAPNRGEALAVTLTFPDGSVRTFLVPSGPAGALDSGRSEPGEVLPTSGSADPAGWEATIELT
jgi:hypothetical protein